MNLIPHYPTSYRNFPVARRMIATAALGLMACTPGWAATIFSDDFTGVTNPNTVGYYFTSGSNNSESVWNIGTSSVSPLSGDVLRHPTGWATNTWAYKQFELVSLSAIGDSITLQLDFTTPAVTSGSFAISLLYSANTITANDFTGTNPLADSEGYSFYQGFSASATSPAYRLIEDNANAQYAPTLFTPSQSTSSGDGNGYTFGLTMTLISGGLQLSSSINGVVFDSYTIASGAYTQFNTLRLTNADTGQPFYFDNISVATSAVPEPSAVALLAMGVGLILMRRRSLRRGVVAGVASLGLLNSVAQAGEIVEVKTTAVGDGGLVDASVPWDDQSDKVEDMEMGAKVGSNYGTHGKAIFEFSLPPKDAGNVKSAVLKLYCNGQDEGEALSLMDVDVYGYQDERAEGSLDGTEWAEGKLIGQILVKGETDLAGHKLPPFDVTEFVRSAIDGGRKFAGFRLEARDADRSTHGCLVLRTAEFDEQYQGNAPTLVLELE